MNSFPAPESSPLTQSSANKSKLSKTPPGTNVNGKRKSLFPKVVLPLHPKSTNKKINNGEKTVPARRRSGSKKSNQDPDFVPDSSMTSSEDGECIDYSLRNKSELKKQDLNATKVSSPKSPPKTRKTPKTPKTPKKVETQNSLKKRKESDGIDVTHIKVDELEIAGKKIKLNYVESEEVKKEEIVVIKKQIDWKCGVNWMPGKLAWARFGNYPFWPCVVTLDPESGSFHRTMATKRVMRNLVHVQYFGDNERHSWVVEVNMLPFSGADDFDKFIEELSANSGNLSKKKLKEQRIPFIVSSSLKIKWEIATCEATEILNISDEDRACIFAPAPPIIKSSAPAKKKRKLSLNDTQSVIPVKKAKRTEFVARVTRSQTPKVPNEVVAVVTTSRKLVTRRRSTINSSNLDPNKKNSKINKSCGDLSKIVGTMGKMNGTFSKSTGNLIKLFDSMTPKGNVKLLKNGEKSMKVSGKVLKNLKSCQVEIYDSLSLSPPTPPSSLLNSSWDEDKKNFDTDYDSKLLSLCDAELDDEIKEERCSDQVPLLAEEFNSRSLPCDADVDSDLEAVNKSTKKRKSRSKRDSDRGIDCKINKGCQNIQFRDTREKDSKVQDCKEKDNKEKDIKEKDREKEGKEMKDKKENKEKEIKDVKDNNKEKENKDANDANESEKGVLKWTKPINLFRGIRTERVCQICEQTGKLVRCKGPCYSYYHLKCVKPGDSSPEHSEQEDNIVEDEVFQDLKEIQKKIAESESFTENLEVKAEEPATPLPQPPPPPPPALPEEETFKCIDCLSSVAPACFICNDREIDRDRCSANACGKYYHSSCLKSWPQSYWQGGRLVCPYHMCHTCSSDNPQNGHTVKTNEKLVKCVRCPSAYHTSSSCLPAGSEILTGNQIICPKHYKCRQAPLNATWCFLCTKGGSLICCESCPTSFHPECLGIKTPDGAFMCEDCETGRLPLYGEIVWVKLGSYRWWPSKICFPDEVPVNVDALKHETGEFCVMFFGTKNYYWVHKGRAFLYQEGDAVGKSTGKKNGMDGAFRRALQEAHEYHQILKEQKALCSSVKEMEKTNLKPPFYIKLKINKPVGNVKMAEVDSIVACACSPSSRNPCAQDSDCLNRMLLVECSPDICPAGVKCKNQCFVQRLYPSMEPFHTNSKGWGLRSLEPIKSNQFVIEYVGEIIDAAEYRRRLQRKKDLKNENYYFLTIDPNRMIDAEHKGNISRFMNHSCNPNCVTQKWTVNGDTRVGLFALRDIRVSEELTFNYNLVCDGEKRKTCLCRAPNCSGFIGLKVTKNRNSAIQEKKVEKPKISRKPKKVNCYNCQKEVSSNESAKCKQKGCSKEYHKTCVKQNNIDTKFICPLHLCFKCGSTTMNHCSVCKIAFCQVHLPENMVESKGTFVCKNHKNGLKLVTSSIEDRKEAMHKLELDQSSFMPSSTSSPIVTNKMQSRNQEQSTRVSIEEVQLSGEDNEETLTEDTDDAEELDKSLNKSNLTRRRSRRISKKLDALKSLNSEQLLAIIGGGV